MKVEAVLVQAITLNPIEVTRKEDVILSFAYGAIIANALVVLSSGQIEITSVILTDEEQSQIDALMQTINTRLLNE